MCIQIQEQSSCILCSAKQMNNWQSIINDGATATILRADYYHLYTQSF